ncbi:uncharacterized protein A4U43_UnF9680 [Asparagus officinalis]|uniref:Cytochrome P450 n=1 Tax=Asparagus officinalis TaxID=4686 RepID=A0A1R3L5M6_ASPOF|nr:premnaspirodiene oxygenase-like [Asparagus officinalis]ONK54922.1 uncharacterized protein A4U43_UnF9680 [Asparagus officinalis]
MRLKLGPQNLVVISSPSAAQEVTKSKDLSFASRPEVLATKIAAYNSSNISFCPYGPYWRQVRKIAVIELLSNNRVKSFFSLMREESMNLVQEISTKTRDPINLSEMFVRTANAVVCRAAYGSEGVDDERFLKSAEKLIRYASGFSLVDVWPKSWIAYLLDFPKVQLIKSVHRRVDAMMDRIIGEHQKRKSMDKNWKEEDLVDVMLRIKESGELDIPLTMNQVKAVLLDMFFAGTDTTSTILAWAMSELCKNPKVMEKARQEIRQVLNNKLKIEEKDITDLHYLKLVIKETLRLHGPTPLLLPRVCRESCEVGGFTIPEGSRVVVNVWAIARDPKTWGDDAEVFRPERFEGSSVDYKGASFEFLPFGAGRRICPGAAFGLATMEICLAHLLYYFNWKAPDGMKPEDLNMTEGSGLVMKRKNDLLLIATPYLDHD